VESAGALALPDQPALPVARQAGAALGVDLSDHLSQRVEDLNLSNFDLILTMERGQRDALRHEYPEVAERIVTVSQVTTGYDYDVIDPPGHTAAAVMTTSRELDDLLARATPRLIRAVAGGLTGGLG
jgi:protein-tyrosine phosphatase